MPSSSKPRNAHKGELSKAIEYQKVFGGAEGQRVLQDMMRTHRVLSSTFSKDPMQFAMNEGERNVVLRILTIMKIDIKQLEEQIRENDSETY